jgi:hypothetical protein
MNEMTTHCLRSDFHCALLWLRSMEIATTSRSTAAFIAEIDECELFRTYVSPIKA